MPAPEFRAPSSDELAELAASPLAELAARLEDWRQSGAAALPTLRSLEAALCDPAARKLVRRALHRLRAAGVEVARPQDAAAGKSVLQPVSERLDVALLAPPDADGCQRALLVLPERGELLVFELILHGERGVLALRSGALTRSEARELLRGAERSAPRAWVRVDALQACALVARAERWRSAAPPLAVDRAALELLLRRAGPRTPGELARELGAAGEQLSDAEAEATLASRLRTDGMEFWRVGDPESWATLTRELESFEHSRIILSPGQQRDRRDRAVRDALLHVFNEAGRERLAERLEESAALWSTRGDARSAGAALHVASELRRATDPGRVAFARRCFEGSLGEAVSAARDEQRGRVVLPG
jgi:hypothetical protein